VDLENNVFNTTLILGRDTNVELSQSMFICLRCRAPFAIAHDPGVSGVKDRTCFVMKLLINAKEPAKAFRHKLSVNNISSAW
jgi:hypothetical protein